MLLIHRYNTPILTGPSLHFTSLQLTSLHFTSPTINTLHGTPRFTPFTALHFTSLHFTSLQLTSLHFTSPTINTLHGTPRFTRFTELHFTSLQFTALFRQFTTQSLSLQLTTLFIHFPNPLPKSTWFTGKSPYNFCR